MRGSIFLSLLIAIVTFSLLLIITILEFYLISGFTKVEILVMRSVEVGYLILMAIYYNKLYKSIGYSVFMNFGIILMFITIMTEINTNTFPDLIGLELLYLIILLYHVSKSGLLFLFIINVTIFIP